MIITISRLCIHARMLATIVKPFYRRLLIWKSYAILPEMLSIFKKIFLFACARMRREIISEMRLIPDASLES